MSKREVGKLKIFNSTLIFLIIFSASWASANQCPQFYFSNNFFNQLVTDNNGYVSESRLMTAILKELSLFQSPLFASKFNFTMGKLGFLNLRDIKNSVKIESRRREYLGVLSSLGIKVDPNSQSMPEYQYTY